MTDRTACARCATPLPELDGHDWPIPEEDIRGGQRWVFTDDGEWVCGRCSNPADTLIGLLEHTRDTLWDLFAVAASTHPPPPDRLKVQVEKLSGLTGELAATLLEAREQETSPVELYAPISSVLKAAADTLAKLVTSMAAESPDAVRARGEAAVLVTQLDVMRDKVWEVLQLRNDLGPDTAN